MSNTNLPISISNPSVKLNHGVLAFSPANALPLAAFGGLSAIALLPAFVITCNHTGCVRFLLQNAGPDESRFEEKCLEVN